MPWASQLIKWGRSAFPLRALVRELIAMRFSTDHAMIVTEIQTLVPVNTYAYCAYSRLYFLHPWYRLRCRALGIPTYKLGAVGLPPPHFESSEPWSPLIIYSG